MPTKFVAPATSLEGSKKNDFRSFIYSQSSTNAANFVKIGPVDVELIGDWQKSLKMYLKNSKT